VTAGMMTLVEFNIAEIRDFVKFFVPPHGKGRPARHSLVASGAGRRVPSANEAGGVSRVTQPDIKYSFIALLFHCYIAKLF